MLEGQECIALPNLWKARVAPALLRHAQLLAFVNTKFGKYFD